MYLVDTNIILEALLEQDKTLIVKAFLESTDPDQIFITDLTLHSIGIILFRLKKQDLFISFLNGMIIDRIDILSLNAGELREVERFAKLFQLDFDDAYQYVVAQMYNLQLISFDKDFDHTLRKRKEPSDVI